jgi:hypothetical protein
MMQPWVKRLARKRLRLELPPFLDQGLAELEPLLPLPIRPDGTGWVIQSPRPRLKAKSQTRSHRHRSFRLSETGPVSYRISFLESIGFFLVVLILVNLL